MWCRDVVETLVMIQVGFWWGVGVDVTVFVVVDVWVLFLAVTERQHVCVCGGGVIKI